MKFAIRAENSVDFPAVRRLVQKAFAGAEHTDGDEQNLVERLRAGDAYIPELALVAEEDGVIIGHIMFTRGRVGRAEVLALAPVSVIPAAQGRGVGAALIREGHRIARGMGHSFSVVLGHAAYYPRFGYRPASQYGIKAPFDVPAENFMACDLQAGSAPLGGVMEYAGAFFERGRG